MRAHLGARVCVVFEIKLREMLLGGLFPRMNVSHIHLWQLEDGIVITIIH